MSHQDTAATPQLDASLRAALHPAWLRRLRAEWDQANRLQLRGALRPPVLGIDVGPVARWGQWQGATRTLTISESHLLAQPWHEVVATLRHEMAHQYVDEVLNVKDETAHGPAFAEACRKLQVDARATGRADTAALGENVKIIERIKKLLALAQSQNVHEAEAAMAMANRLLLEYNLDVATTARADYGFRRIGVITAAIPLDAKLVAGILSEFFFVECIWVTVYQPLLDRDARQLEILGDAHNLELGHYVHDFLHHEADRLWRQAQPMLRRGDRRTRREYVAGVLLGFRDKLRAERDGSRARGLVWVGDPALKSFYRQRYPRVATMSSAGVGHSDAHAAGRAAGHDLRLHRGVSATSQSCKLLGRD